MVVWGALSAVFFLLFAYRSLSFARRLKLLRDEPSTQKNWPKVSVIIPACNETDTLEQAARSLLTLNYPELEFIMVDDRSTDATHEIMERIAAGDPRVRVIKNTQLPKNWMGKTHSMHKGVQGARGEWYLFTDADIHFSPACLKKAIHHCTKNKFDFLAVLPRFLSKTFPVTVFVSQFLSFISLAVRPDKISDPQTPDFAGVGAFNLVRAETFKRSPGFEWLRLDIADDLALAKLMKSCGARMSFLGGKDELAEELYPTWGKMIRGTKKGAMALSDYSYLFLLVNTLMPVVVVLGFFLSAALGALPVFPFLVVLGVYFICGGLQLFKVGSNPLFILTGPLAMALSPLIIGVLAVQCAWNGKVTWRDTSYSLKLLKENQRVKFRDIALKKKLPRIS